MVEEKGRDDRYVLRHGLLANRYTFGVHVPNRRQLSLVDITLHTDSPCLPFLRSLWTGLGGLASDKGSLQGVGCFCVSFAFLCFLLRCGLVMAEPPAATVRHTLAGEILLACHR
jgi:hypothetical protein